MSLDTNWKVFICISRCTITVVHFEVHVNLIIYLLHISQILAIKHKKSASYVFIFMVLALFLWKNLEYINQCLIVVV